MSVFHVILLIALFHHQLSAEFTAYNLLRSDAEACGEYKDIVEELVPGLLEGDDLVSLVREAEAEHAILCEREKTKQTLVSERTRCHIFYLQAASSRTPAIKYFLNRFRRKDQATAGAPDIHAAMNYFLNKIQGRTTPDYLRDQVDSTTSINAKDHMMMMMMQGTSGYTAVPRTQIKPCQDSKKILEEILTKAATMSNARKMTGSDWRVDSELVNMQKSAVSKQFAETLIPEYPTMLCKYYNQATVQKFHHKTLCSLNKGINRAMWHVHQFTEMK